MSLPGLQLDALPAEEKSLIIHELPEEREWRFEVAFGDSVDVKLLSGTAEIFGTELALGQTYTFTGRKAAIYTWNGCRLEVTGSCQIEYTAEETPMMTYANLHFAMEDVRESAIEEKTHGTRVLVVGPENAGKTSLVKLLAAYATKMGRQPVVVNLDTKEGMFSIPGTVTAVAFSSVIDVEDGWGSSPTNGPSEIPVKLPLVYYCGVEDPVLYAEFYKPILTRLALSVTNRMEDDDEAKYAGCIIDTPGSVSVGKDGYDIIQHIVAEFSTNILVVLGSERLYNDMARRFAKQTYGSREIAVVKVDKSGGCVDRDAAFLHRARQSQIRQYFFGNAKNALSPHTQLVDFSEMTVYRIVEKSMITNSLLPGGETDETSANNAIFEPVPLSPLLESAVLAIVQAEPHDTQEGIRDAAVIGFVYVAEVDERKRKVRVLSPLSGRLPRKAMVLGLWPENGGDLVG